MSSTWATFTNTPPFHDGIVVNVGYVNNKTLSIEDNGGVQVAKIYTENPPIIIHVNNLYVKDYINENKNYSSPYLVTDTGDSLITEDGTPLII
jgi:hypothetical protein